MGRRINCLHLFILVFLLGRFSLVDAQVSCVAKAPSQVAVGQPFQYQVTLNQKASQIVKTNFSNFDVLSGPNSSSSQSITIINGTQTINNSYTYSYTLAPKKEGTFKIPPTSFRVDGKTVSSNEVTITVTKGRPQPQSREPKRGGTTASSQFNKNDVFIKAFASKTNPYIGEEVIITHKLYIGPSVNGGYRVENINLPSQPGLWSYTLGDPNAQAKQSSEVIDGKRFVVYEIRKTAVFPQKEGDITITPMEMKFMARVLVQRSSGDPFFDRFFGSQSAQDYDLDLKSNAVRLQVKPTPSANKPALFSGLSGQFSANALLSRSKLQTNDATNLTITISGTGNIQHIEIPEIQFPSGLDVADPKITDNINTKGDHVSGSRIIEYVIIPRNPGSFTIPSVEFSFFDPRTGSYRTVSTNPFTLEVEKGSGQNVTSSRSHQKEIQFLGNDIRYIKTNQLQITPVTLTPFLGSPLYYTLLLTPLLLGIIIVLVRKRQIEYYSDHDLVRNRGAKKLAQKKLKHAHQLLQDKNNNQFYEEISRALWGYMSDKYHIPTAQLSIESIEAKLEEKGISKEIIQQFIDTLSQCEYARFAPGDKDQLMHEMYQKSIEFIQHNETISKKQ